MPNFGTVIIRQPGTTITAPLFVLVAFVVL
jgi:hypothetical protein